MPALLDGRLLIFVKKGSGDREVDTDELRPADTWVTAREVHDLTPGASIEVDASQVAFPKPFSKIPRGDYEAQAVLDVDRSYNYSGRGAQDWISDVIPLAHWSPGEGDEPVLTLTGHPQSGHRTTMSARKTIEHPETVRDEEVTSSSLSRFWGREIKLKAWVVLPPGYTAGNQQHYPTVYWTHGFGGTFKYSRAEALKIEQRMTNGKMPPMIWVMVDESIPQGTHEFADSVNDGPWGTALTSEFLPYLERKYRMDARPNGRLLNGHSSGGWATLQLEVNYPKIFGGTWSTSPDPSDFHDFTGTNLYATGANVYHRPDGSATPLIRQGGRVVATFEQFARLEAVLGPYGGQVSSFDWVFSPKGPSGMPVPMFDRETGAVDPAVVKYWHDHYDLAHLVDGNWSKLGPYLKGRIHLIVGTADTFYLDGAAHKFEAVLIRLRADPHFTYIPGRTHFDLYTVGKDRDALFDKISAEMYAVARPGSHWSQSSN
ncbi:MAG TPA: alpha/beta hydrolase-fold protein [Bryobacteraceae bacterium]|nr:alpha/beta hydrolase-fold protein [Bryobacteraceae bacterium]